MYICVHHSSPYRFRFTPEGKQNNNNFKQLWERKFSLIMLIDWCFIFTFSYRNISLIIFTALVFTDYFENSSANIGRLNWNKKIVQNTVMSPQQTRNIERKEEDEANCVTRETLENCVFCSVRCNERDVDKLLMRENKLYILNENFVFDYLPNYLIKPNSKQLVMLFSKSKILFNEKSWFKFLMSS